MVCPVARAGIRAWLSGSGIPVAIAGGASSHTNQGWSVEGVPVTRWGIDMQRPTSLLPHQVQAPSGSPPGTMTGRITNTAVPPVGPGSRFIPPPPPPQLVVSSHQGQGNISLVQRVNRQIATPVAPRPQIEVPAARPVLRQIPVPLLARPAPPISAELVQHRIDSIISGRDPRTHSPPSVSTFDTSPPVAARIQTHSPQAVSTIDTPPPVSLKLVAEDASVLLELFSQSAPDDDDDIGAEHHTMIATAAAGICTIQARFRQSAARRNEDIQSFVRPDDSTPDGDCIICYCETADRVFMPCNHLVVCTVGRSWSR